MTVYVVAEQVKLPRDADWENPWMNGAVLDPGMEIEDGEIEPDIVAKLVSQGKFVPKEQYRVFDNPEDVDEDVFEDENVDEDEA